MSEMDRARSEAGSADRSPSPGRTAWPFREARHAIGAAAVPCLHCRLPIEASSFEQLSSVERLVATQCPHCDRRVTMPERLWLEWSQQ
jgi:hypothetical protein